jgi:hypothetical protein
MRTMEGREEEEKEEEKGTTGWVHYAAKEQANLTIFLHAIRNCIRDA